MDRPEDRLALIEVHERDGRPLRWVDVQRWPLSVGRALDNTLVLDDPHVAPHHARIEATDDGRLRLIAGASANGLRVDGRLLAGGQSLELPTGGAWLQLGHTKLRLRLPGELLAAERPLAGPGPGAPLLAAVALLLAALLAATHAVRLDPGAGFLPWLPLLLGAPAAVVAWCALWALAAKLFQHRFDFGGHLAIALPWLLAITLVDLLWPQLAAALGWPLLWQLGGPLDALLATLFLGTHLRRLLPQRERAVAGALAALLLVWGGVTVAQNQRSQDRLFAAPYMSTLPPPWLRLQPLDAGAQPLLDAMAPLRAPLAARVQRAAQDEADGDDDE